MQAISKAIFNSDICLVKAKTDGIPCYYYMRMSRLKYTMLQAKTGSVLELTNYGEIVESGYGEPTSTTKKRMKDEYGFEE